MGEASDLPTYVSYHIACDASYCTGVDTVIRAGGQSLRGERSVFARQQVQAEHLGCGRAENPSLILEELLRADRCIDLGCRHYRSAQA